MLYSTTQYQAQVLISAASSLGALGLLVLEHNFKDKLAVFSQTLEITHHKSLIHLADLLHFASAGADSAVRCVGDDLMAFGPADELVGVDKRLGRIIDGLAGLDDHHREEITQHTFAVALRAHHFLIATGQAKSEANRTRVHMGAIALAAYRVKA